MQVLLYFIITQAITICSSFDVEIEGFMRLGDEFLKKLNDDLYESRKVQTTSRPAVVRPIRPDKFYIGHHKHKARKTGLGKDYHLMINTTANRIKTRATARIRDLQTVVKEDLKLQKDISRPIWDAIGAYTDTFDKYVNGIIPRMGGTELDFQFLLLDIIETSNKLLYSTQKRIFNEVVDENKDKLEKRDIISATEKMFKQNIFDKKRLLELLCLDNFVCRPYPGFTDYFAELISDLLRLSDHKFRKVLHMIKKAFNNDAKLIKQMVNKRSLEKIKYHLGALSADTGIIRDIVSILRAVIVQRHKVIDVKEDEMRNRTAAVKILFDIIDKAFEREGPDAIAMNIEIVVQSFRHWKTSPNDMHDIVVNFFRYVFNTLKLYLGDNAKREITVLTEVIFRGTSKARSVYKYLLASGSKFVRGEDLHMFRNIL